MVAMVIYTTRLEDIKIPDKRDQDHPIPKKNAAHFHRDPENTIHQMSVLERPNCFQFHFAGSDRSGWGEP